ncbi:MAG: hypothetical protein ACE5GD_02845 [Candidatus Geothermarchaeales archaeon]
MIKVEVPEESMEEIDKNPKVERSLGYQSREGMVVEAIRHG